MSVISSCCITCPAQWGIGSSIFGSQLPSPAVLELQQWETLWNAWDSEKRILHNHDTNQVPRDQSNASSPELFRGRRIPRLKGWCLLCTSMDSFKILLPHYCWHVQNLFEYLLNTYCFSQRSKQSQMLLQQDMFLHALPACKWHCGHRQPGHVQQ